MPTGINSRRCSTESWPGRTIPRNAPRHLVVETRTASRDRITLPRHNDRVVRTRAIPGRRCLRDRNMQSMPQPFFPVQAEKKYCSEKCRVAAGMVRYRKRKEEGRRHKKEKR